MKILFAMDASQTCRAAVSQITDRPWPPDSTFSIVHVVGPGTAEETPEQVANRREAGFQLVHWATGQLTAKGLNAQPVVIEGNPRTVLLDWVRGWKPELVLVGSLGMGIVPTFFLGSVAKKIMRESGCSVGILRPNRLTEEKPERLGMKVLLATDGTAQSLAAICSIINRPWPRGSEFRIVSVAEPLESLAMNWLGQSETSDSVEMQKQLHARQAIEEAEKTLARAGLITSSTLLIGNPQEMIVEEAQNWGADLIVVGTRPQHGPERILMGSVSDAVAIRAACSVEVIRPSRG